MQTKVWNKEFISIFFADAAMNMSKQMINTLVSKYASSLGATATVVGEVVSMFAITSLILKIFAAPVIDTCNRKFVLICAMLTMGIASFGYSFSTTIPLLKVFRLLQGAGQAFSATCCLVLASDALPTEKMGVGIGYFSLGQVICQAVGPAVGLALADMFGYSNTFRICAVLMVCAVLVAFQIKSRPAAQKKVIKLSVGNIIAKEAILPSTVSFFAAIAYQAITTFMVIYAGLQGVEENIGLFFTVYAITLLFARPTVGKLADKYGITKVLVPALACFAGAFLLISVSDKLWMFLLAAVISAVGNGSCLPIVQALCMRGVPRERRGAASCTNYIAGDLSSIFGTRIGGIVADTFGYQAMWRIMILPLAISAAIVLIFRNRLERCE